MWRKRLTRWLLLVVTGLVLFFVARLFLVWDKSDLLTGQAGDFLNRTTDKVVQTGGQVLGQALEQASLDPKLKETIKKSSSIFSVQNEDKVLEDLSPEEIGRAIKELPANQAKEIKKEIFGDFCQEVLDD